MRNLEVHVTTIAREAASSFVERQAGRIVQYLAQQALDHMEYARLTGALPDEVRFDYNVHIETYLR